MELLEELREDSLKKTLPPALIALVLGLALYFAFGCYDLVRLVYPKALDDLTAETMEGVWLEDDITYFHMAYAQELTYQDGRPARVTGSQYVVRFDSEHYMGLFVHRDGLEEAERMMSACNDFYAGKIPESQIPSMHVKGTIRAMDEQTLGFYLAAANGDKDVESIMLPYYIDVGRLNGRSIGAMWAMLVLSILLMAAGLALGACAMLGVFQKRLRDKAAAAGDLKKSMERVRSFYEQTQPVGGVRVRSDYIMFQRGPISVLLRPWDVSWAYHTAVRPLLHWGKRFAVILCTTDNRRYTAAMDEKEAVAVLRLLDEQAPGVVLGYTSEKERSYRNDPTFAKRWEAIWPGCTDQK